MPYHIVSKSQGAEEDIDPNYFYHWGGLKFQNWYEYDPRILPIYVQFYPLPSLGLH